MRGPCACTEGLDLSPGMSMIHTQSPWTGSALLHSSRCLPCTSACLAGMLHTRDWQDTEGRSVVQDATAGASGAAGRNALHEKPLVAKQSGGGKERSAIATITITIQHTITIQQTLFTRRRRSKIAPDFANSRCAGPSPLTEVRSN